MAKTKDYLSPVIKSAILASKSLICQSRITPDYGFNLSKDAYEEEDA